MVVGDDHVEAERTCLRDLVDRGDAAVHRQHEAAVFTRETRERLAGEAVALLEPAGQVPVDVGAQPAQNGDRKRRRADAVDVVVAVHADAPSGLDRPAEERTRLLHVAQERDVVARPLGGEKGSCSRRIAVAPPDEHARRRLADGKLLGEGANLAAGARTERPSALVHTE